MTRENHENLEYLCGKGRECLKDYSDYARGLSIFDLISKSEGKYREIGDLYKRVIHLAYIIDFYEQTENLLENRIQGISPLLEEEKIISLVEGVMSDSTNLNAEDNLYYSHLSEIEKIIDRIPFKKMKFKGRKEFEELYMKFKEYCIKSYLHNKSN